MELGEKIRRVRQELGLSQRQLCGQEITRNMLSLIENGGAKPSMKTLEYLARQLGKPISFFLDEHAEEKQNLGESWVLLNRAEEALAQDKTELARDLLEKEKFPQPELERKRLLLLSRLPGADYVEICQKLPSLDRELLFRAEAALLEKKWDRCGSLLAAAEDREQPSWLRLWGRLQLARGCYAEAADYLLRVEDTWPGETARELEICFRELGDFQKAYEYACKQRG
jgi:transcriptional regulator with XRE-family HTH domain